MPKVLVVKPFRYAADGITSVAYVEGDEPELKDAVIEGLEKEGFIVIGLPAPEALLPLVPKDDESGPKMAVLGDEPHEDVVKIADDWHAKPVKSRKALASKIAGRDVASDDDANVIIEDELARRQNAKRHQ